MPWSTTHRRAAAVPKSHSDFRLKILIDNYRTRSPCCACAAICENRRATEPRNERPPSHSITSSAIANKIRGMFRLSASAI